MSEYHISSSFFKTWERKKDHFMRSSKDVENCFILSLLCIKNHINMYYEEKIICVNIQGGLALKRLNKIRFLDPPEKI